MLLTTIAHVRDKSRTIRVVRPYSYESTISLGSSVDAFIGNSNSCRPQYLRFSLWLIIARTLNVWRRICTHVRSTWENWTCWEYNVVLLCVVIAWISKPDEKIRSWGAPMSGCRLVENRYERRLGIRTSTALGRWIISENFWTPEGKWTKPNLGLRSPVRQSIPKYDEREEYMTIDDPADITLEERTISGAFVRCRGPTPFTIRAQRSNYENDSDGKKE